MSKVTEAADALEQAFMKSAPAKKQNRLKVEEWSQSLQNFYVEAFEIRKRYSLGWIARARSAYILQQRLIAGGYPADVVRKVVFSLVLNSFSDTK